MTSYVFYKVVHIWIVKPHVAHKKVFASRLDDSDLQKLSKLLCIDVSEPQQQTVVDINRHILPKDPACDCLLEEIHFEGNCVSFVSKDCSYKIVLVDRSIEVHVTSCDAKRPDEDVAPPACHSPTLLHPTWLELQLASHLNRWLVQELEKPQPKSGTNNGDGSHQVLLPHVALSLVDVSLYQKEYLRLKEKYGPPLCQSWQERTDPLKFVYEDIAIACYLMCIWHKEPKENVYFADLGCGNGLLVYILIQEGFRGVGIDVRERGIWATYPENVRAALVERALVPESSGAVKFACSAIPAETTWLVGNHSDELTPWIPVWAALASLNRTSLPCNYFLLPCCPWNYFAKFHQVSSAQQDQHRSIGNAHDVSRYQRYLSYLQVVGSTCGFHVATDTLRIPSTKRVAHVGTFQMHADALDKLQLDITNFITASSAEAEEEAMKFPLRSSVEGGHNCTRNVSLQLRLDVCSRVFHKLLALGNDEDLLQTPDGRKWSRGGELPLGEVSGLLSAEELTQLRHEHGGLQTLLRNQHQTFQVVKATVRLRIPVARAAVEDSTSCAPSSAKRSRTKIPTGSQEDQEKRKLCWMHENHPQGCFLLTHQCRFAHGADDLRL